MGGWVGGFLYLNGLISTCVVLVLTEPIALIGKRRRRKVGGWMSSSSSGWIRDWVGWVGQWVGGLVGWLVGWVGGWLPWSRLWLCL